MRRTEGAGTAPSMADEMKAKQPKLVMIEWIDSASGVGYWKDIEDAEEALPAECTTVGFLIDDGPDHKTVASSITGEQAGGTLSIPKSAIRRTRQLISKSR